MASSFVFWSVGTAFNVLRNWKLLNAVDQCSDFNLNQTLLSKSRKGNVDSPISAGCPSAGITAETEI